MVMRCSEMREGMAVLALPGVRQSSLQLLGQGLAQWPVVPWAHLWLVAGVELALRRLPLAAPVALPG